MTRAENVSPEIVDRHGVLLRAFLTRDGYWRMRTRVQDVSPRYLALLKAYEDKNLDEDMGFDVIALSRVALQYLCDGHVGSVSLTLTMQVARLLEPPHTHGVAIKLF